MFTRCRPTPDISSVFAATAPARHEKKQDRQTDSACRSRRQDSHNMDDEDDYVDDDADNMTGNCHVEDGSNRG